MTAIDLMDDIENIPFFYASIENVYVSHSHVDQVSSPRNVPLICVGVFIEIAMILLAGRAVAWEDNIFANYTEKSLK